MDTCTVFQWQRHKTRNTPQEYLGTTVTLLGSQIWAIHGSSSRFVFSLNLVTRTWTTLKFQNDENAVLLLHTASLFDDKIYLYGVRGGTPTRDSDDLWELDTLLKSVDIKPTYGNTTPGVIALHSSEVCERLRIMALFGGRPIRTASPLWLLDLESFEWKKPKTTGEVPTLRWQHASCIADSTLFILGGGRGLLAMGDLHLINLDRFRSARMVWHKVDVQGRAEFGRKSFDMAYVGSGRLIVYGGYDGHVNTVATVDNVFSSQPISYRVFPFDNADQAEPGEELRCTGTAPDPKKTSHLVVAKDKLYTLGNFNDLDVPCYELGPG